MDDEVALRGAYSREDAAKYIGCGTETLRKYVYDGWIAPRYHGTKPVYLREDLDDLLRMLPSEPKAERRQRGQPSA